MSVLDDDVAHVRQKIADLRAEIADQQQQLIAIPGWLWIGDPDELADDDVLASQAESAHQLQDALAAMEAQLRVLTAELDVLDGESPASWSPGPRDVSKRIGVMLPLRLETRFYPPPKEWVPKKGVPPPTWSMRVRVEPDPVSIGAQAPEVVRLEADLVRQCWKDADGDLHTDAGAAAFRVLADQCGAPRAAYLLRTVQVVPDGAGFRAVGIFPERPTPVPPLLGLPARLGIWGDDGSGLRSLLSLEPDLAAIAEQSRLDAVLDPTAEGKRKLTWWNSFAVAQQVGLAGEIVLGEATPHFEILMCVGLGETDDGNVSPAQLFTAHANAGRLGTMAPLTPTNTVAGEPTSDLGRDPQPWLDLARSTPGPAGGLAGALTGNATLAGVPAPDLSRQTVATAMIRSLWPVLWQRSLKDIAGLGEEVFRLGDWAGRHLHPYGPYPVARIGDLPYGVLSISDFEQWKWREADPATGASDPLVERQMAAALNHLAKPYEEAAGERSPAAGATAEQILDLLSRVPVTPEYGSRNLVPTVILATLFSALGAKATAGDVTDVLDDWAAQASYVQSLLDVGSLQPLRRYSPVSAIEPWPKKNLAADYRDVLKKYLETSWGELAEVGDLNGHWDVDGRRPPVLARLIRHALLLSQVEIGRILPTEPVEYVLPLHNPDQMFDDAQNTPAGDADRVPDVPQSVESAAAGGQLDPRGIAVTRQFEDVRAALIDTLLRTEPELADQVLPAVLDTAGHRLDAWYTGLASRRLEQLIDEGVPMMIGAYGWVDDLRPSDDPTPPTQAGLLHAPGYSQALVAAVLRDHSVHDPGDKRWQVALHSATIRVAAALGAQVRSGIHLSEALGREIERFVGEPGRVVELRRAFPARPEWEGRRVCDGQQVLDATKGNPPAGGNIPTWLRDEFDQPLMELRSALDTYADLLIADALHDVVDGRPASAAESLEAAAGLSAPPELRLLRTQREGGTVRTKVMVALPWEPAKHAAAGHVSPSYVADPAVAEWLDAETGPAAAWVWTNADTHDPGVALLELLGYGVADLLVVPQADLAGEAASRLGISREKVREPVELARARQLLTALGGTAVDAADRGELLARLTTLRSMAAQLRSALQGLGAGSLGVARQWGLPFTEGAPPAVAALTARLTAIGPATTDTAASADELARRIRTLLPPAMTMPLVCPATLPTMHHDPKLDTDWLPVIAAVRPSLAGIEVVQLTSEQPWNAAISDAAPIWAAPPISEHGLSGDRPVTVVYGPGLGEKPSDASGKTVGLTLVDSWAETVPAGRHTTWASFGYDAPRARAPQALLVVVPPDPNLPLSTEDVLGAVQQARRLARVRSVTAPTPDRDFLALPTPITLATSVTACVLTEEP